LESDGASGAISLRSLLFSRQSSCTTPFRLRGHVQRHAETINQLLARHATPPEAESAETGAVTGTSPVSEHVGHNLPEIAAGIVWGVAWAVLLA
jgi:acid phosphatase family membrane protein YuiD